MSGTGRPAMCCVAIWSAKPTYWCPPTTTRLLANPYKSDVGSNLDNNTQSHEEIATITGLKKNGPPLDTSLDYDLLAALGHE